MKNYWLIAFESGCFLSHNKKGITYFGDNALIFENQNAAEDYYKKNLGTLEETGLSPSVAQISSYTGKQFQDLCGT